MKGDGALVPCSGLTMTTDDGVFVGGPGLAMVLPSPRPPVVQLDPDGRPYGWSFSCADCGLVYVYEENPNPSHDHAMDVMAGHADELHPGWRQR